MNSNKTVKNNTDENLSSQSLDSDISEIGLCSVNKYEFLYNSMLCLILMQNYKEAYSICQSLIENTPQEYIKKLWVFKGCLSKEIGKIKECNN